MTKYNEAYLEYLSFNIEAVADLIEAVKKAKLLGLENDPQQFTPVATEDILEKLSALLKAVEGDDE